MHAPDSQAKVELPRGGSTAANVAHYRAGSAHATPHRLTTKTGCRTEGRWIEWLGFEFLGVDSTAKFSFNGGVEMSSGLEVPGFGIVKGLFVVAAAASDVGGVAIGVFRDVWRSRPYGLVGDG